MKRIFLGNRLFYTGILLVFLFLLSWTSPALFFMAKLGLALFIVIICMDIWLLFNDGQALSAERNMADRFSNGDANKIQINVNSRYNFEVDLEIIDEIPPEFQRRDINWKLTIPAMSEKTLEYSLTPRKRGVYNFGTTHIYAKSPIGFIKRRYSFEGESDIAVYPSYLQLRKYELAAFARSNFDLGVKKMRRIGNTLEFEQIKDYTQGDDTRFINWKATARRNELMVNQFQDQKSQHIISIIDKGRLMKMPFEQMTLLDYAINACLVISNIAIKKGDKAGVMSYAHKMSGYLPADKRRNQMYRIQEFLYAQKTNYREPNFEVLQSFVHASVKQRSLLLLFTNFESLNGMRRHLPYFRMLSKKHILVVIFFQNTELNQLLESKAETTREVYIKVIAEKQHYEKLQIVSELKKNNIYSVLTTPKNLSIDTINKYLEIKARGII